MLKYRPYKKKRNNTEKPVYLLHGGPAAAGYLQPVAEKISEYSEVIEPFQRVDENTPITVKTHINDLKELIENKTSPKKPVIIGHSWGAMLALAFACEHQNIIESLILVGCGTFDETSRSKMNDIIKGRMTDDIKNKLAEIECTEIGENEKLGLMGRVIKPIYSYDIVDSDITCECNAKAHKETWDDMMRLQKDGIYPQNFSKIKIPVTILHGDFDPHPGNMVYACLKKYIPHIKYICLEKCGHDPWLEKHAADEFYDKLHDSIV